MRYAIRVTSPFTVVLDDRKQHHFSVGRHEVDEDVANHWYTRANIDAEPEALKEEGADDDGDKSTEVSEVADDAVTESADGPVQEEQPEAVGSKRTSNKEN